MNKFDFLPGEFLRTGTMDLRTGIRTRTREEEEFRSDNPEQEDIDGTGEVEH
jgi:hypothetical protein